MNSIKIILEELEQEAKYVDENFIYRIEQLQDRGIIKDYEQTTDNTDA